MHSSDNQSGPTQDARASEPEAALPKESLAGGYAEAATDFLGLDQEIGGASTGTPGVGSSPGAGQVDTSNSWLLSLEGDAVPQAGSAQDTLEPDAEQDGADGAGGAPTDEDETQVEPEAAPRPRRSRLLVPVLALAGCALVAGGWYVWQGRQIPADDLSVAHLPAPAKPAHGPKAPAPTNTTPPTNTTEPTPPAVTPTVETTPSVASTDPAPAVPVTAPAPAAPRFQFGPRSTDARVERYVQTSLGLGQAVDEASGASTIAPSIALMSFYGHSIALNALGTPGLPATLSPEPGTPDLAQQRPSPVRRATQRTGRGGLRLANDADLAGVWDGHTIPLDAVDKDARLLTPQVGRVRVTIHGGEIFEGRLYAVGEKQIWLDTDLGRMALVSQQVALIQQLSSPDGTPVLGADGSQLLAGLPRVRVRTLGGPLYGKVIGRDERTLTLITDGGARITVDGTAFEPAPDTNAIIVRGTQRDPAGP
jgi:hypothetical protein